MSTHSRKMLSCGIAFVLAFQLAALAGFRYDVHINDAEAPSLTFGVGDQTEQLPAPPFSGMFGVMDIHLLNTATDAPAKWFDRLSSDVKTAEDAPAQGWVVYAKNNATLKFKLAEGDAPENLMVSYERKPGDADSVQEVPVDGDLSLPVKTGGYYVMYLKSGEQAAPDRPEVKDVAIVPPRNADGSPNPAERTIEIAPEVESLVVNFCAGTGVIGFLGQQDIDNPDWIVKIIRDGYSVKYNWATPSVRLEVTFTRLRSTRDGEPPANDSFRMQMTPTRSSAPPVSSVAEIPAAEGGAPTVVDAANWLLRFFGTLDFDGNKVVDMNDVMFFYNYVDAEFGKDDPSFSSQELRYYTDATVGKDGLDRALEFLKENLDILNLDGNSQDGNPDMNDVMYLYNFVDAEFGKDDPSFSSQELKYYTTEVTDDDLDKAYEKLKELLENSDIEIEE